MTRLSSFIFATIVAVIMMVGNNGVHAALQRGAKTGSPSNEQAQNLRQLKMENRGIGMSGGMTAMTSMGGMTAMTSMGSMGGMTAMASMGGMTAMASMGGMGGMRRAETVAERTRTNRVAGIKGGRIINQQ